MADGHEVKTIEGLAADGAPLHPMQEAFREHHGLRRRSASITACNAASAPPA